MIRDLVTPPPPGDCPSDQYPTVTVRVASGNSQVLLPLPTAMASDPIGKPGLTFKVTAKPVGIVTYSVPAAAPG
jgi:hypothetical protein